MARFDKEKGEDVAFIEDVLFSLGFIAEISSERALRHDTHLAVVNRLIAAAPKPSDLEDQWEQAKRIDEWHGRDEAMKAAIRRAWQAADILRQIRMTLHARSAELRQFDAHIERHALDAMVEVLRVVADYLAALNRRRDATANAVRLRICDGALDANEQNLTTVSERFANIRQAADHALAESAKLHVEIRNRLEANAYVSGRPNSCITL